MARNLENEELSLHFAGVTKDNKLMIRHIGKANQLNDLLTIMSQFVNKETDSIK